MYRSDIKLQAFAQDFVEPHVTLQSQVGINSQVQKQLEKCMPVLQSNLD